MVRKRKLQVATLLLKRDPLFTLTSFGAKVLNEPRGSEVAGSGLEKEINEGGGDGMEEVPSKSQAEQGRKKGFKNKSSAADFFRGRRSHFLLPFPTFKWLFSCLTRLVSDPPPPPSCSHH